MQGIALEHASGRPLARTVVRLEPVPKPGSALKPLSVRAALTGHFIFPAVEPGIYILTAAHPGYFPVSYGQRLPIGHGAPIEVTADSSLFAELRLRHKGAITGRILDENGVGTVGVDVVAYRARLPLRSVANGASDDRGVFRIFGLEPGKYWVRTAPHTMDDNTGWLPTYATQARETREARTYQVTVDADTTDADVIPEPGSLVRLAGIVTCDRTLPASALVVLSSETGRRSMETSCPAGSYQFQGLAPGPYEMFAVMPDGASAAFAEFYLDRNSTAGNVQLMPLPTVNFEIVRSGTNAAVDIPVTVLGRRPDLAESGSAREIPLRTTLPPGNWEFRANVPTGQYVESIASVRTPPRRVSRPERPADWFDVFIEQRSFTRIRIAVSDQAGQIAGVVKTAGNTVPGVPVFLWPLAESVRRSLGGPLQTISGTDGQFRFDSLPPGRYRVLASFDVNEIDEDILELSQAPETHAEASELTRVELPLWTAP